MELQNIIEHGIGETGELAVKHGFRVIDNSRVISENITDSYSPADIKNMKGFDDKSKELVEVIQGLVPEQNVFEENGVRKVVTYSRRTQSDHVEVDEITRYFDIATGAFLGKAYTDTQSYPPGRSPLLCDAVTKKFIETIHTPECIEAYLAKLVAQTEETP